jgi:hypothetical protein
LEAFFNGNPVSNTFIPTRFDNPGITGEVINKYDCGERVYDPVIASGKIFVTSKRTLYVLGEKNYNFVVYAFLMIFVIIFIGYLAKKYV